jgi:hypothetical protein
MAGEQTSTWSALLTVEPVLNVLPQLHVTAISEIIGMDASFHVVSSCPENRRIVRRNNGLYSMRRAPRQGWTGGRHEQMAAKEPDFKFRRGGSTSRRSVRPK